MPDKPEQVAVVALGPGVLPPANTILTTSYDTVFAALPDTCARDDQIRRLDSARRDAVAAHNKQAATRDQLAKAFTHSVAQLNRRLDAFIARRDAAERCRAEAAARRDQAEQQRRIAAARDALPVADPLGSGFDFPKPVDEDPHQFATGPAHGAAPGADASLPGDPSPPAGGKQALSADKQAAFFGAHMVRDQSEFPNSQLPRPPQVAPPIAAGLD